MKHINFKSLIVLFLVLFGISPNAWANTGVWYATSYDGTVSVNIKLGDTEWKNTNMTKTSNRYKGLIVYECTDMGDKYGGLYNLEFYEGGYPNGKHSVYAGGWKTDAGNHLWQGNGTNVGSWSYDPVFNYAHLYYTKNGESANYKFDGNKDDFDLGTITSSVEITNIYLNFNKNGGNVCATKDNGAMCYKVNNGTTTTRVQPTSNWTWSGSSDPYELQWKNITGKTIASSTDPSGNYTLHIWWELKGDYAGESNCTDVTWYLSNGGNNYTWTYTILPPAVNNFSVSATSTTYGGNGTEGSPYLVKYGTSLTLSASGSQGHSDAKSSFQVKYGSADYSGTTTNTISNITSSGSITVKGKYYNSTDKLSGTETSATTIYYQAVYTNLSAVAYPAAAVSSNPTISSTYTSSSVNVGAGTANTGYKFKEWSTNNGSFGSATTASTTFSPTANSAVATANYQIKVTFDNQSHDTAPADQWIDYNGKVSKPTDLSEAGWEFGGWYKEAGCTNQWDFSTDIVTAPITLYAKWTQSSVYYKITKGVNDAAMGSITSNAENESQVLSGSTITFTAHPNEGYEVVAWYTDAACTEGGHDAEQTTYSQVINSNATVYVKFKETKYSVTIGKGTGIQSVTPSSPQQVGNVTPVGISAEVATGYTWNQWTKTGGVTIADASSINTSIKATGTGTVTATATEILLPLTTSANESYMGSVEETASSIGVATTSQLTATAKNRNYKFKQWHLTNCTITSGTVNDATITIKGDGVNNPSAEAEFEVAWLISGNDDISTGWGASGTKMTVVSDGVFKFEFNATKVASNNGDYNFKVYNTVKSAYYANTAGDGGWWFTRSAASAELAEGVKADKNMSLRSDMVGNYIFTLDCSTSRENPTLTVTFPTTTTYDVDIYYDGVTKTTVEGGAFAKEITANVPQSMRFDHWVVEGETTHVNITDENSQTTTFTASGEGAIIRAKFKVVSVMYLKAAGDVFGDAYVNFYSEKGYWSSSEGSGNDGSECMSKNNHMTKIGKTDIYYLDVSGGVGGWSWSQPFSFVNQSVNHKNFSMCNVVYRSDYNDRLPLYVPRYGWITDYFINCHYYNDGIWMKYNDTYSGYKLWIKEKNAQDATAQDVTLNALTPGGYEFNTTLNLKSGTTYELKIHNENGEWYGVTDQTITASSCTNWHFWKGNNNCKLTASDEGDYTFTLNLGSGEVIISVQYPLAANDYRVIAKNGNDIVKYGDLIKNSGEAIQKDTVSFFNSNYTFRLQKYAGNDTWNEYGDEVTPTAEGAQEGVIDFIVEQDGQGNATLAYKGIYTGNYYIRTDGVDGGWGDYKNNSDNKMDNYGSLIDADPTYRYDVYKAKWILSGKNVKFRVANDYSKAISDEFTTDAIINDKETLPEGANVRFMWNSQTNQLKRAYLSGSTIISDRFLVLEGDAKMFDKDGKALTTDGGGKIADLNDYELNFDDKNNWVYQADIQAQPGCEVKLTAKYNGNIQYFIGKAGGGADSRRKIIDGNGSSMYSLRAVYDFKTNRLVTGWIPNGTIIENIVLGSDMLIERIEQGDASQIVFGGDIPSSLSISNIQHIYGVLKLTKTTMLTATESTFDKCVYWISFPFDVKVSEIFGVEKYGEVWAITKYNGEKRAEKGWFKQDTQTFWEFLKPSDIMKANVGYTLNLDPDYFNKESSEPWKASATEVAWYFPSIKENVGVVSLAQKDTTLESMHCTIDRTFDPGDGRTLNHKFTDSNWRVIGVPAFQNLQAPTFDPVPGGDGTEFGLKGFYEWVPSENTYRVQSASDYTFKATGAYMVQYEGKITWSNAAVITTKAPWHAPEYTYADAKNYSITLEFGNDDYTDQTFVTLIEKASTDFVLNEDMMKIDNAGFPNIYSFAGAYDVAYNETTFENQSVMLGVSAPKDGSYTFAMPKDFSGKAVLVDLETGEATDLNLSNYTVELNKGTYNNRFQLMLEVEAKIPTNIENANGEWSEDGKTKKLLINGNIYLINGGRVYNATGVQLR